MNDEEIEPGPRRGVSGRWRSAALLGLILIGGLGWWCYKLHRTIKVLEGAAFAERMRSNQAQDEAEQTIQKLRADGARLSTMLESVNASLDSTRSSFEITRSELESANGEIVKLKGKMRALSELTSGGLAKAESAFEDATRTIRQLRQEISLEQSNGLVKDGRIRDLERRMALADFSIARLQNDLDEARVAAIAMKGKLDRIASEISTGIRSLPSTISLGLSSSYYMGNDYNSLVSKYNDLVEDYNTLVRRCKALQSTLSSVVDALND